MAPLTAKRSRSLWEIKAALDFSSFPACRAAEPGSGAELWEAKHGIVERYGSATSGDTDCGSSNICFGRGKGRERSSADDGLILPRFVVGSRVRRPFVRDNELAELCVTSPGSYVFLGVLGGFGDGGVSHVPCVVQRMPLHTYFHSEMFPFLPKRF